MAYTLAEITEMFPAIAAHRPEIARQLTTDNGAWGAPTHPEVWLPGNRLDYFLSTGALVVNDHKHTPPIPAGGWESLTNGRWQSGGIGVRSSHRRVVS